MQTTGPREEPSVLLSLSSNMFLMVGWTVGNSTSSNFLKWIKSITVILRWMRGIKFIISKDVLITKLPKPAGLERKQKE